MKPLNLRASLLVVAAFVCAGAASAQSKVADTGKAEYDASCAVCHGATGNGKGPFADMMRRNPSDLTQLAKLNNGVFPIARLYEVIEGGKVPAHGAREMPIWGREFRVQDAEYYHEARGQFDAQALVRARILLLLEYINRLQVR